VYDALSSKRVYKEPWTQENSVDFLTEQGAKMFDPEIARAFCALLRNRRWEIRNRMTQ
jgi:putative two-component system response regulator